MTRQISQSAAKSLQPGKPGRSPANRSLERGIEILRAFRPGSEVLGNGELAERTGLSRATVTRLTQTLTGAGYLQLDRNARAYRLAPAVLSLGHAMKTGSGLLKIAAPFMRTLAESQRINVGIAAPDRDEMVYLESIRYSRRVALRQVVSGQRVPMELTSLGRAYLATLTDTERHALLEFFERKCGAHWSTISKGIDLAAEQIAAHGYCAVSWQPEVIAVASPIRLSGAIYVLNVSTSTSDAMQPEIERLAFHLLKLMRDVRQGLEMAHPGDIG
ncbi:IclR family transcriptional regulator [Pandoraea sp. XJJ-1]|uniref:IclR family transcriptional regulator n=1 Tax=Pandoraea sp. XJJ-1 TaxID=3002643 RepID=UPI0022820889|nr:IclR family transcriptional regulator [Pandoraea sp. XJJ-1]WAL84019.1 IclR family transcriptional regulator [Pandoraea sp. XJJ-1]